MGSCQRLILAVFVVCTVALPARTLRVGGEINASRLASVEERDEPLGFTVDILRDGGTFNRLFAR